MDVPSPMAWMSTCGMEDEMLFDGFGTQFFNEAYQQSILNSVFHTDPYPTTLSTHHQNVRDGAKMQHHLRHAPADDSPLFILTSGSYGDKSNHDLRKGIANADTQKDGDQDYPANSSGDHYGGDPAGCRINLRAGTIENGQPATKRRPARAPEQSRDHIIAERKRREKLNQRFIALSALIPDLKRTDKTSVLGDAVKYIKQLQERVRALEQESVRSSAGASEFEQVVDGDGDGGRDLSDGLQVPVEIEARFIKKTVLLKIHCEKGKGVHAQVLNEIEKLHLSITDAHAVQLCHSILVITIIAQMEMEFDMTAQRLARILRSALGQR